MLRLSAGQHPAVERVIQVHDRNGFQHLAGFVVGLRLDPPGMNRSVGLATAGRLTLQILHAGLDFLELIQLPLLLDRALLGLVERRDRRRDTGPRRRAERVIPILEEHSQSAASGCGIFGRNRADRQEGQRIVEQERHGRGRIDPGRSMRDTRLIGLLTERLSSIALHILTLVGRQQRQPGQEKERERRGPCLATRATLYYRPPQLVFILFYFFFAFIPERLRLLPPVCRSPGFPCTMLNTFGLKRNRSRKQTNKKNNPEKTIKFK